MVSIPVALPLKAILNYLIGSFILTKHLDTKRPLNNTFKYVQTVNTKNSQGNGV